MVCDGCEEPDFDPTARMAFTAINRSTIAINCKLPHNLP
jgi:hypothetical protein